VPVLSIVLVAVGAVLFSNLVAAIPGRLASHTSTALVLRAEGRGLSDIVRPTLLEADNDGRFTPQSNLYCWHRSYLRHSPRRRPVIVGEIVQIKQEANRLEERSSGDSSVNDLEQRLTI
jgi:hypothetical protein